MNIDECIRDGYLKKVEVARDLVDKEFKESLYDLSKAKEALEKKDFKWAIVKSYYSMFHAARAVLFSLGYKERRHFAIQVVLEDLERKGKVESLYLEYFSAAMEAREGADYRYEYSEKTASDILEYAEEFIDRTKKLIG